MAMSMGPPTLPGFSLRVQLYSPHAHTSTDKPLRCFRVVTSPESTVREFCQEASRIHEINYGEPIAVKKCQDDQEFDITQAEVLGTLFANAATIRIIQAPAVPGGRDSVPPTSALRYEPPNLGRKREREVSARANGSPSSATRRPNKRPRISDLDPDRPLQSRERDQHVGGTMDEDEELRDEIIPDSQQESAYAGKKGSSRHVRDEFRRISETPELPQDLPHFASRFANGSADCQGQKSNATNTNDTSISQTDIPGSLGARNSARSKSASYHIQRATERGTSVSTAATSPLSGDQQVASMNANRSSNIGKIPDPISEVSKTNGKASPRSENEESIYDNVPSDSEGSSILKKTKEKLKGKNGSPSGLPGIAWAKKFNTPPSGSRRSTRSHERITSNGELPLTPISKEREERQRQKEQADEDRKARMAAAEAAERRKREADEIKEAANRERLREVRATAVRLEKERAEEMERERKIQKDQEAEEHRLEQERIRGGKEQAERAERERKTQIDKNRQEAEIAERKNQARIQREDQEALRFEREKAQAEDAERVREEQAQRRAKETALAVEAMRKSRERSEQSKASTPDRSKETPIKAPSATPFIPSGRKSALKALSSQAAASSSPALARTGSVGSSTGSGADHEPPTKSRRKVSFNVEEGTKVTPIRPPILPSSRASALKPAPTPPSASKASSSKALLMKRKEPSPKPSESNSDKTALPIKKSTTPIPPPKRSKGGNVTPVVQIIIPPRQGSATKPAVKSVTPPVVKSTLPAAQATSQTRETSVHSAKSHASTKSPVPLAVQVNDSFSEESEEGSDEDDNEDDDDLQGPSRINPVQALNSSLTSPAKAIPKVVPDSHEQDDDAEENEDEDVEMQDIQSNRSSSRSPIMFNSQPTPAKPELSKPAESASSVSDESNDEDESVDEDESADDEEEEEEEEEDKTITIAALRSSIPAPSSSKPTVNLSGGDSGQRKNLLTASLSSSGNESYNTQDEVDIQLTSSLYEASASAVKSTPIPIPKPKFTVGASLSSLNAKPFLGASTSKANGKTQPLKLANNDEDSEEESEESDSDSSSDSDFDKPEASQTLPKHNPSRYADLDPDTSTSDSDSESANSNEDEDEKEKARNELAAQIAQMTSDAQAASTQSYDPTSPKLVRASQSIKSSGKKAKDGNRKFLTGYVFSQPK